MNHKFQKNKLAVIEKIAKYEAELQRLREAITWRWGETRRFQSNTNKINRRNWLIGKLVELKTTLNNLN